MTIAPRRLAPALLLALFLGCSPEAAPTYAFDVLVERDPDVPLPGAKIVRGTTTIGESDAQGRVKLTLSGAVGETVELGVECPAGHRPVDKPLAIVLRQQPSAARSPEYRVACPPEQRKLVVTVRAQNGAGLPVRHLGRELARTDEHGAAHALLMVEPGTSLTLELDTSASEHRWLRPQNPKLEIVTPDRDEVALFDQPFTVEKPKPKAAREHIGPKPIRRR